MDETTESNSSVVAPFVMKTYQMVSDPTTNGLISWGRENNSFIVLEPLDFSRRLLPVYFKHNNFSSFVRQLNTYGFRKVDPDKWEFANEWFLRGQTHLLSKIVRKKHTNKPYSTSLIKHDDELFMEITKLKQEQKSLEQEVESMNRRLEATERRPQQMMTFLYKVAKDPDILPRMMLQRENNNDKKRKLLISAASNSTSSSGMAVSSSSAKSEDDQDGNTNGTPMSSPDGNLDVDNYCCQSDMSSPDERIRHLPLIRQENYNYATLSSSSMVGQAAGGGSGGFAPANGDGSGGDYTNYYEGIVGWDDASPPPPYPFSLLGGGF